MRRRFRTLVQYPWRDWEKGYLREIGANAKMVVVRVVGLFREDVWPTCYTPNATETIQWELAMQRLFRPAHRFPLTAHVILQFRRCASPTNPMVVDSQYDFAHNTRLWAQWSKTLSLSYRLGYMLTTLRHGCGGLPFVLHVEDWSVRWAADSGFIPDRWLLDNPFISRGEIEDRWPKAFSRPAILRQSRLSRLSRWDHWNMHLRRTELLALEAPSTTLPHGEWTPYNYRMRQVRKYDNLTEGTPCTRQRATRRHNDDTT